jgi:hypothetical protein
MIIDFKGIDSYFINLDKDTEKAESAYLAMKNCGIKNIQRYPATQFDPARTGLAITFKSFFKEISDHQEPVLVCEDDIKLNPKFNLERFEVPDDADALYVGISSCGIETHINPYLNKNSPGYSEKRNLFDKRIKAVRVNSDIYRIYNMLNAHGVIMINNEYTKFLEKSIQIAIDSGGHQDQVRAYTMPYWNVYALNIPMFFQDNKNRPTPEEEDLVLSNFTENKITDNLALL